MKKNNQNGLASSLIILIVIGIIIAGGLTWYFAFYQKANKNTNLVTNTVTNINANSNANLNANTNPSVDTSDWQTFTNNNYHYQISYPKTWYYLSEAMSGPPAPATAFFSSVEDSASQNYASLNILVTDLADETLDTSAEIKNLEADGYIKSNLTLDSEAAVKLERHTLASDTGATIYAAKDNYMYRLVWGATSKEVYEENNAILSAMANSFKFMDPLVADFTQTGNLDLPAESQSWYLLWEAPGNPAVNRELVLDANNYTSLCVITAQTQGNCTNLLANGLLAAGDRIQVEGISGQNNQVYVIKIIKQ